MSEYTSTLQSLMGNKKPKMAKYEFKGKLTDATIERMTPAEKADEYERAMSEKAMRFYIDKFKSEGKKEDKESLRKIRKKYKKRFGK